ncbi:glycerophosphodiester phosphodiesterase family protein [Winogradskyella ursingii]|uniref:glycerophosphodiester phosphodiesterase family protein n=1 Tax=Winogradskyella ursingii TaxID=2686079 RepID=UPI0015C70D36|nr:glycerophosphodiester phosphodiesterase family protein [Winogradskyella ursingii]
MNKVLILLILLSVLSCKQSQPKEYKVETANSELIELFKVSTSDFPKISVHRGGKGLRNYPENCLETLKYVSDSITAIFEIDVAQTKDGQLVLMHDNSVDRTTTGTGLIKELTYNELQNFNLKDDFGNATDFKIPLLSEVLEWSKQNNSILTIDIKRGVEPKDVIKAIKMAMALDTSIIITYDVEQAKNAYNLAPQLLLSVSARNHKEYDRLLQSGIPKENMLAFTGTRLSERSLYERLHNDNIVCILGTLGNLDRQAEARGDELYSKWLDLGADVLATDRPFEVAKAIK